MKNSGRLRAQQAAPLLDSFMLQNWRRAGRRPAPTPILDLAIRSAMIPLVAARRLYSPVDIRKMYPSDRRPPKQQRRLPRALVRADFRADTVARGLEYSGPPKLPESRRRR